jgi:hypothetical protein
MKQLILPVLVLLTACSSRRKDASFSWRNTRFLAWNEDTIVNYRVVIAKDNTFLYTTEDTVNHKKVIKGYGGHVRYSQDTVYLLFKGNVQPPMRPYLIGARGGYFSQLFKDGRKLMYLRIMPNPLDYR